MPSFKCIKFEKGVYFLLTSANSNLNINQNATMGTWKYFSFPYPLEGYFMILFFSMPTILEFVLLFSFIESTFPIPKSRVIIYLIITF